jgi:[NiFe] hydrogenase assembly HybE family chaperone
MSRVGAALTDPFAALRLAEVFQTIAGTRMAQLPLCNPALGVEAVAFRPWQGGSVGVLITPWCMNLVFLPGGGSNWEKVQPGTEATLAFPSGHYVFLVARASTLGSNEGSNLASDLGSYLASSLFSPMFEFSNMDEARAVAESVMAEVFSEAPAPEGEPAASQPGTQARGAMNRRDFLAAWIPRGERT